MQCIPLNAYAHGTDWMISIGFRWGLFIYCKVPIGSLVSTIRNIETKEPIVNNQYIIDNIVSDCFRCCFFFFFFDLFYLKSSQSQTTCRSELRKIYFQLLNDKLSAYLFGAMNKLIIEFDVAFYQHMKISVL